MAIRVRFWGVRGSIACPTLRHIRYGGNTSCVEVVAGNQRLILDAGTGLRELGQWLIRHRILHSVLLLSHTHWDHIDGFPFFGPIYHPDFALTLMAGHLYGIEGGIRNVIDKQMSNPYFPVPIAALKASLTLEDFQAGDSFTLGGEVRVRTTPLNHPGLATGYRIDYQGRSLCYITDTEHVIGQPNQKILALIEGADLVIYDATYTDTEFTGKIGWGHSTWQEGVRLCRLAKAKSLAIFHHDPAHDDAFMARLEARAQRAWSGAVVVRQGMRIKIG